MNCCIESRRRHDFCLTTFLFKKKNIIQIQNISQTHETDKVLNGDVKDGMNGMEVAITWLLFFKNKMK